MLDMHIVTNLEVIIRILFAAILGSIVGYEREWTGQDAGFRTHILVGLGACLMMLLSLYGFKDFLDYDYVRYDPSRIPSYVVSGVGFLGAGTIMVYGGTIRGLTTAASIWAVAGLGLVVGVGMYDIAIVTTVVILLSLIFLNNLEKLFVRSNSINILEFVVTHEFEANKLVEIMLSHKVVVYNIEFSKTEPGLRRVYIRVKTIKNDLLTIVMDEASKLSGVRSLKRRV